MSKDIPNVTKDIDAVGTPDRDVDPDHDTTNGRWLEAHVADRLEEMGYNTVRNKYLFGLETDVIARRKAPRDEPDDFIVVECKDWHRTSVQVDAVEGIALRAALARAMPILVVERTVTAAAWKRAQLLDVRIITDWDIHADRVPPLTRHRPPQGTLFPRREPSIYDLRDSLPVIITRRPSPQLDIEAPVFSGYRQGPCYVPDRTGNGEYVKARKSDYEFDS